MKTSVLFFVFGLGLGRIVGAWQIILKTLGGTSTFEYDSPYWTNTKLLNDATEATEIGDAKYGAFNTLGFDVIRLWFDTWQTNCVEHHFEDRFYESAVALFSGKRIGLLRELWTPLLTALGAKGKSQNCPNLERIGFNIVCHDNNRVRFGFCQNGQCQFCRDTWDDDADLAVGIGLHGQFRRYGSAGYTSYMQCDGTDGIGVHSWLSVATFGQTTGPVLPASTTTSSTTTSSTTTNSTTTSSLTTTSTTFLSPSECTVGYLHCPVPDGDENYTVLGSEGLDKCTFQHGAGSHFLSFAISDCNTSTVTEDGKQTYHATLVPRMRGPIEFSNEIAIGCSCEVITFADLKGVSVDGLENNAEEKVTGLNVFEPEMRVYASNSFTTTLVHGQAPRAMANYYIEIASLDADDHIGVGECSTAPSADEDDELTRVFVSGDACEGGNFGVRRLENPLKNILRMETLAFKFRGFDIVHLRCTVVRCDIDSTTCGSCGVGRRLSASASADQPSVGVAVASFVAPISVGNFEIYGKEELKTSGELGEGEVSEIVTSHTSACAISTLTILLMLTAMITEA